MTLYMTHSFYFFMHLTMALIIMHIPTILYLIFLNLDIITSLIVIIAPTIMHIIIILHLIVLLSFG